MKDFKGTKGEWKITTSLDSETDIRCNGLRIAEVKHFQDVLSLNDPSIKEGKANAKLIAAAPELLAALNEFKNAIDNEDITMFDNLDHDGFASTPSRLYAKIEQAINKAV